MSLESIWHKPKINESSAALYSRSAVTLLMVPLAVIYAPSLGWKVFAVTSSFLMPVVLFLLTHGAETARVAKLHMWYGLVLGAMAAVAMPAIWAAVCISAASTITAGVYGSREATGTLYGSAGAAAIVGIGWIHGVDHWAVVSFGLMVVAPAATSSRRVLDALLGHETMALKALTSGAQAIIWEADAETKEMLTVAGSVEPLTGFSPREWGRIPFAEVAHPDDIKGFRDFARLIEAAGRDSTAKYQWEGRISTQNNGWQSVRESLQLERGNDGSAVVRGLTHDIGEVVAANHLAAYRAKHDELTDLPNRTFMFELVTEALAVEGAGYVALLHIDIDRFTEVNRTLGHAVGDSYLRTIANRLRNLCHDSATLGRLGGDEFAIMVKSCDEQQLAELAGRVITTCSEEMVLSGLSLRLGASVGTAIAEDPAIDEIALFRQADSAVHEAKKKRNTWHLAKPEDLEPARHRLRLAGQVTGAIEQRQLELFFQPKLNLVTEQVVGFEGLIRWRHADDGLLFPDQFLDIIDLSGQFDAFNRLVVQSAIEFCAQALAADHRVKVALNLSGKALQGTDLVEYIASTTEICQVDPELLVIEVTEDAIGDDLSTVKPALEQLAALGCGISIDDFGTGDSSLVRLKELPVTEVKIDRSFIAALMHDKDSAIIVRSTLDLAATLGLSCVAEGIEDDETARWLVDHGCPEAQGYLYCKPVPADEALHYMIERASSVTN